MYKIRNLNKLPQIVKDEYHGSHKGDLYEFVESIINGSQEPISTKEVLDVMAVSFALEETLNARIFVKVC